MKTNYELQYDKNNIKVLKDGKIEAQGFTDNETALNAIWALEGKDQNDFYVVCGGVVERIERDSL